MVIALIQKTPLEKRFNMIITLKHTLADHDIQHRPNEILILRCAHHYQSAMDETRILLENAPRQPG